MPHLLKRGGDGPEVRELQTALVIRGFVVAPTGRFDTTTYQAVRAFQSQNVDRDGQPLKVDGSVGDLTWAALTGGKPAAAAHPIGVDFTTMPPSDLGGAATGRNGLKAAIGELTAGAGEIGGDNSGPWVEKYLDGRAPPGSSWCAGFVSWCLREGNGGASPLVYSLGARDILAQCRKRGWAFPPGSSASPLPGDLVVWWRVAADGWQGHVGFVHQLRDGKLYTIEGNKSAFVQGFSYTYAAMDKLLGFCRLPDA
ncbi:CHAP domain-containing protein [Magnetospirillum sp. 15-1]|uniref:CHAP domain-containing protein n=1 Tax=Magnetospirillum sp. 15-1 TaxID=1979370 RepID=UPI000BBBE1EA|nr:CHAP domain-containing protein [Magnetospirillum sp. 15-1]